MTEKMKPKIRVEKSHTGTLSQRRVEYKTVSHMPGVRRYSEVATIGEIQSHHKEVSKVEFFWWINRVGIDSDSLRGNCDTLDEAVETVETKLVQMGYNVIYQPSPLS